MMEKSKVHQIFADLRFMKVLVTYVVFAYCYIVCRLGMNDVAASQFVYFVSSDISCISRSRDVAWAPHFWPPATTCRETSGDPGDILLSLCPAASWHRRQCPDQTHQELLGRGSSLFPAVSTTTSRSQAWTISSRPLSLGHWTTTVEKFQFR